MSYFQQYSPNNMHTSDFSNFQYTKKLFQHDIQSDGFFKTLEDNLPPFFTRKTASEAIGGLISAKTLANLDSRGLGPSKKIKVGLKVGYERDNFLCWLRNRTRNW